MISNQSSQTTAIGSTNTKLDTLNTTVGTGNSSLATIQTNTAGTNSKLDTVNTNIGSSNTKLDILATNQVTQTTSIGTTNNKLDAVNTSVGTTNTNTATINTTLTSTNTKLDTINTTLGSTLSVRPYVNYSDSWYYAAVSGGITTTLPTVAKAAASAGIRNYITGLQVRNAGATQTEVLILDGTTVIWRSQVVAGTADGVSIRFDPPLRGTAATAINVQCSNASIVYANLQGFIAP